MRTKRALFSASAFIGLGWAVGCGVDGSLTFVPDDTFNGASKAGASGAAGAAGSAGQQMGGAAGASGGPVGGAGGKATFDPKCISCLSNKCPALFGQCAADTTCVECVLTSGGPDCAALPVAVALRGCACNNCENQCDVQKCGAGMGGMGGASAGMAGMGGTTGGVGGSTAGVGGSTAGVGGSTAGVGGSTGGVGGSTAGAAGAGGICGNGKVDPGEGCDGALPAGQTSCAEFLGDPSATGHIDCVACQVDASDCHACGDGTVNLGEECDGTNLGGATCTSLGRPVGTLLCDGLCKYDFSNCNGSAPTCGDGLINSAGEECDGNQLGGETCESLLGGAYTGLLSCSSCVLDLAGCHHRPGFRDGPLMSSVPKATGGSFGIDQTEVTRGQYDYFLQHLPPAFGLPPFCSYESATAIDLTPDALCLANVLDDASAVPGDAYRLPVVCVDFCDALAFCQWSGKTLCGGVTVSPPNAPWDKLGDSSLNAWTSACSANGQSVYPYGDAFAPGVCNDDGFGIQAVGSRGGCHSSIGGYETLTDMSGNVAEWNDACQGGTGASDLCAVRGGSFATPKPDDSKCSGGELQKRAITLPTLGFRCCELTGMPAPL